MMCGRGGANNRSSIQSPFILVCPLIILIVAPHAWNILGLCWKWVGLELMQTSSVFFAAKPALPLGCVRSLYTTQAPSTANDPNSMAAAGAGPKWAQKTITLPPQRRGCHLITPKVQFNRSCSSPNHASQFDMCLSVSNC